MTRDRGFVLLAVLLVLTLLAVIVTELAFSGRLEASLVRSYRDGVLARHLVEAAVQQAIREIATPAQVTALDETGQVVFYRALPGQTTPTRLPALPRVRVALGPGEFSYRLADESARLGLNTAGPDRLDRLLEALGLDRSERDIIGDSLQDWRDPNEAHRLHGAESDFYLALPVPYRARPIQPMGYTDGMTWSQWLVDDQREASGRPDVLVFTTGDWNPAEPFQFGVAVNVIGNDSFLQPSKPEWFKQG